MTAAETKKVVKRLIDTEFAFIKKKELCIFCSLIGKSYQTKNLCTARNKENVASQLASAPKKVCFFLDIVYREGVRSTLFHFTKKVLKNFL